MYSRHNTCSTLLSICIESINACTRAESSKTDQRVRDLEQRVQKAMALPGDHRVHFTDLHDALTTLRFHGKRVPEVRLRQPLL